MQKSIAFFDFDGTITRADTMLELAKFSAGKGAYWLGMVLISPWLVAMKLGIVSKSKAKEKLISYFFGGDPVEVFDKNCISFNEQMMPSLIRKDAMAEIQKHIGQKTTVVIVSASAENWVAPWCATYNLQYICSRLQVENDKITGKLRGGNCSGKEKVSRIKKEFNLADYTSIYCYGDTPADSNMLQLATHPHYRVFKN